VKPRGRDRGHRGRRRRAGRRAVRVPGRLLARWRRLRGRQRGALHLPGRWAGRACWHLARSKEWINGLGPW